MFVCLELFDTARLHKFIQCPARASARDVNVYKSLSLKELPQIRIS